MEDIVYWDHNVDDGSRQTGGSDVCMSSNATYWHRVQDDESFNFCPVASGSADAALFISVIIIVASLLSNSRFSRVFILLLGCATEALVYTCNFGRIGNAFTIWLSIPSELLMYGILPPLLLHISTRVSWLAFKSVFTTVVLSVVTSLIIVSCTLAIGMTFAFDVSEYGWSWKWALLLASMILSTDSSEVSHIIHIAGGPQLLSDYLNTESMFTSVMSLTVFSQTWKDIKNEDHDMDLDFCISLLAYIAGGFLMGIFSTWVGLAGMIVTRVRLKETTYLYGMALLVFYISEYLNVSGAVSVITIGMYATASGRLGPVNTKTTGFGYVDTIVSNMVSCLIMFLGGTLLTNFMIRSWNTYSISYIHILYLILCAYLSVFALRWVSSVVAAMSARRHKGTSMLSSAVEIITIAGIRGTISILMISYIASDANKNLDLRENSGKIILEVIEIASIFVMLTYVINLPAVPSLLRSSGLFPVSKSKSMIPSKVKISLNRRTREIIKNLKADEEEILRGVDWTALQKFAKENISQESGNEVRFGMDPLKFCFTMFKVCVSKKSQKDDGSCIADQNPDIEQPFLHVQQPLISTNMRQYIIEAAHHGDRETPFISRSSETNNPFLNPESRQSSSSYLPSQASPGWSSPTETHRPSEGEFRTWWGTGWKHTPDSGHHNMTPRITLHSSDESVATKRAQIIWTIKRYIHIKEQKGLISGSGISILERACMNSLEDCQSPLDLWATINEQLETFEVQSAAWVFHSSRVIVYSSPELLQKVIGPIVRLLTSSIGDFLSKSLLATCEVMITYYNALNSLLRSYTFEERQDRDTNALLKLELEAERHRVYQSILDRETEAPAHFEAVQTYRAMMAVTYRQIKYIDSMFRGGILGQYEYERISQYIQKRKDWLEYMGPKGNKWQSVGGIFFSLPIFKGLDNEILQTILDNGSLREFGGDDLVWDDSKLVSGYAFCIIVRGLVKAIGENARQSFYGSGTLIGILPALTDFQVHLPTSSTIIAQSSKHDKGVLAFFFPKDVLDEIKLRAAEGEHQFEKMLLKMQRQAALDIHSSMKSTTMNNIELKYQSYENNQRENKREMLALGSTNAAESNDMSDESIDSIDARRIQSKSKKYARMICSQITEKLQNARCIELHPYEPFIQSTHFILLSGSVQRQSPNTGKKLGRSISMTKISAPYVVPMLSWYDASIHADAKGFLSGHQGAVIMVCGMDEGSGTMNRQSIDLDNVSFSNMIMFGEDDQPCPSKSETDVSDED